MYWSQHCTLDHLLFREIENTANCVVLFLVMPGNHTHYLRICKSWHQILIVLVSRGKENALRNAKLKYDEMEQDIDIDCEQTCSK